VLEVVDNLWPFVYLSAACGAPFVHAGPLQHLPMRRKAFKNLMRHIRKVDPFQKYALRASS
jgi:hypothetical protein